MLGRRGYLAGWATTETGARLSGLYHELDLLIAEALGAGILDGLDPPGLAALVSSFTYEARNTHSLGHLPSARLARRFGRLEELADDLRSEERSRGLPPARAIDAGFSNLAYEWARGTDLRKVLAPAAGRRVVGREPATLLSGGDFVRNIKELVDLLAQLSGAAGDSPTARTARRAAASLTRGVIEASSVLAPDDAVDEEGGDEGDDEVVEGAS